jgi:hypothetical protein
MGLTGKHAGGGVLARGSLRVGCRTSTECGAPSGVVLVVGRWPEAVAQLAGGGGGG